MKMSIILNLTKKISKIREEQKIRKQQEEFRTNDIEIQQECLRYMTSDVKQNLLSVIEKTEKLFKEKGFLNPNAHWISDKSQLIFENKLSAFYSYSNSLGITLPELFSEDISNCLDYTDKIAIPVVDNPIFVNDRASPNIGKGGLTQQLLCKFNRKNILGDTYVQLHSGVLVSKFLAETLGLDWSLYRVEDSSIMAVELPYSCFDEEIDISKALVSWKDGEMLYLKEILQKRLDDSLEPLSKDDCKELSAYLNSTFHKGEQVRYPVMLKHMERYVIKEIFGMSNKRLSHAYVDENMFFRSDGNLWNNETYDSMINRYVAYAKKK